MNDSENVSKINEEIAIGTEQAAASVKQMVASADQSSNALQTVIKSTDLWAVTSDKLEERSHTLSWMISDRVLLFSDNKVL